MKLHVEVTHEDGPPYAVIDDEPDQQRWNLLFDFLRDVERNEDLYLAALDRAEAGTPELYWTNHYVDADMYPDGRVVITKTERLLEDGEKDNPPQITITIGEARKLILDWIEARDKWYAEREAQRAAAGQSK
jgi:hypothetical protein